MNRMLTLTFLGSVAATSIALAQPGGDGPPCGQRGAKHFKTLDADGSGGVSLDEMTSAMRGHFAKADGNSDGRVTRDEMKAHHEAQRDGWQGKHAGKGKYAGKGKHFERIDSDANGAVEPLEIDAMAAKRFKRLDRNDDGQITQDEMKGPHGRHHGEHGKHRGGKQI